MIIAQCLPCNVEVPEESLIDSKCPLCGRENFVSINFPKNLYEESKTFKEVFIKQ